MDIQEKMTRRIQDDEGKNRRELLYELRLQRLENLRMREQLGRAPEDFEARRELQYLENIALFEEARRNADNLDDMMDSLLGVIRSIFQCDQAWLMYPCDPDDPHWHVPYRSTSAEHPIPMARDQLMPTTPDLAENSRLALKKQKPVPLGEESVVKDIPEAARKAAAKSALLIALYPKTGKPWLMGLHQCAVPRYWTDEEKQMFQDLSGRISDNLSATLFYRDLEQNQERLKHLSSKLFQAREDERKRIAEEIHDELAQPVLAVKMGVENALYLLDDDAPEALQRSLESATKLTQEVVTKMRSMQTSLYPPTLRDFGVITALCGFMADFANIYTTLSVYKDIAVQEEDIPEHLRVEVFRLAQEALYNAGKHSQADTVTVGLKRENSRLMLEIKDTGVGFDPATTIRYPARRLGLGLTSMMERTEMSGGTLEIDSNPGCGTTIRASWKLDSIPVE
ncbi:sensor histidine kinase [Pseudodesulfovibrio sp. zrk46]|uniref:sensor histidine kinase n=1 Tax=Pseudodesulfovibrio sp. zrk46 TaxID=2725288 RepID=UPI0014499905|nr:sensor histidine kinase [Pseudodesulfovibrio sp. zrk46]QJB55812.1 sensor histidine kinase [Pseudodesulfovibrio sp. zrk46]